MATGNIKNFEWKIGKTGLITIIVGMVALLCVAFLIGVDVGKNIDTYPEKIASLPQRALALVWRPAKISVAQNMRDSKNSQPSADENIDLTFYTDLTGKKDVPSKESVAEKQQPVLQQKDEEPLKRNSNSESQKSSQTPTEKNTETQGTTAKKDAIEDIISSKNKFFIQVASLKEKSKADQMCKKISSLGYKAEIVKFGAKEKGNIFRVLASGFENKTQAQNAAQKISLKTGTNCMVKSSTNATEKN